MESTTDLRATTDLGTVTTRRRNWKGYKEKQKIEKLKAEVSQLKSEKDSLHTFPACKEDGIDSFDGTERLKVSQAVQELVNFIDKYQAEDPLVKGRPSPGPCKFV